MPPVHKWVAVRKRSRQNGQALVEFGFIFPVFILILFTIVDMGLLFNGWIRISSGSREAAREAAVGAYFPTVVAVARRDAPPGVSGANLKVAVEYCVPVSSLSYPYCRTYTTEDDPPPADDDPQDDFDFTSGKFSPGSVVRVVVTADTFQPVSPFGQLFLPLVGATSMRYEGGRAS